jgi:hypothetical protein
VHNPAGYSRTAHGDTVTVSLSRVTLNASPTARSRLPIRAVADELLGLVTQFWGYRTTRTTR